MKVYEDWMKHVVSRVNVNQCQVLANDDIDLGFFAVE